MKPFRRRTHEGNKLRRLADILLPDLLDLSWMQAIRHLLEGEVEIENVLSMKMHKGDVAELG